jgi:hypothetical protein
MVMASTGVAVMGSFAYGVAVSLSSASYLLFFLLWESLCKNL